jgi:pimeloyl-ACP methyl ester carboxylesterase
MLADPPAWFTEALAAPVEDRSVRSGGARIAYRAWGAPGARGAVLIHGTAAHAHWWDHIAPFLAAAGLRVAALSISGHGDSDARNHYTGDQWAAEVVAVAADAGIAGPPFIIGHSLGGAIASRAAATHGDQLGGVVIVDSAIYEGPPPAEVATQAISMRSTRSYPTREAVTARFRLVPEHPVLPYVREHVAAHSVAAKDNGEWGWKFDQALFDKMDHGPLPPLPSGCRAAILRGQYGLMTPDMADRLGSRLGRPTPVTEIPAAGHHVLLDEPLSLVAALRAILAGWVTDDRLAGSLAEESQPLPFG